jgi:hypothetical protein
MIKNPFVVLIGIFGAALLAYQLGWSSIYPEISYGVTWFFVALFAVSLVFAVVIHPTVNRIRLHRPGTLPIWMAWVLCIGFVADIAYTGGVPLWLLASGQEYSYTNFGIPTLHVAIVTFGGTFAAIRFADYLYSKNPWFFFQMLLPVIYDVLIVNRGAALITIVSWMFILVIKRGRLGIRLTTASAAAVLIALFVFGAIGNIRSGSDVIEEVAQPTEAFTDSGVPKPYFWAYVYMTSPIANFIQTTNEPSPLNSPEIAELVTSEMLPDFISKRVLPLIDAESRAEFPQVSPALNVSTIFARSYIYSEWTGVAMMVAVFTLYIMLYVKLMSHSAYAVPALALTNTLVVFCVFDNMIAFTGMSLQLAWLLFMPASRRIQRLKNRRVACQASPDE